MSKLVHPTSQGIDTLHLSKQKIKEWLRLVVASKEWQFLFSAACCDAPARTLANFCPGLHGKRPAQQFWPFALLRVAAAEAQAAVGGLAGSFSEGTDPMKVCK